MVKGLFSPDTVTWKIHSDPSMVVGGIRALLEQALHPVAMDGVAKNSNFREDAWGRLQRTGEYVSTITFGTSSEAQSLAERVRKIHFKLGLDDPHLLLWVHMAMVDSFLDCAARSGLGISDGEQDQYVSEMVLFANQVGIESINVPTNVREMKQYFIDIAPELSASDDAKKAALFLALPPMPNIVRFATPATPMWATLSSLAALSLPPWARKLYGWPTLPGQGIATDIALKTSRASLLFLPKNLMEPPLLKQARERWGLVAQ
ncbi:MAG: oxygenase MpaB family protein [Actinomycetes bacterium]